MRGIFNGKKRGCSKAVLIAILEALLTSVFGTKIDLKI